MQAVCMRDRFISQEVIFFNHVYTCICTSKGKKILVLNMLNKNKNNVMIKYTSNIGSHIFLEQICKHLSKN